MLPNVEGTAWKFFGVRAFLGQIENPKVCSSTGILKVTLTDLAVSPNEKPLPFLFQGKILFLTVIKQ